MMHGQKNIKLWDFVVWCVWRNQFAIRDGLVQTVQIIRHCLFIDLYTFLGYGNFPFFSLPKLASYPAFQVFIQVSDQNVMCMSRRF